MFAVEIINLAIQHLLGFLAVSNGLVDLALRRPDVVKGSLNVEARSKYQF